MNNKKSVVLLTLVVIFIIGVSLVSAGVWDSIKDAFTIGEDSDLEGELEEQRFDATVTLTNAPARIVAFRPADDVPDGGIVGEVQPVAGTTVTARITFIVEDPNGPVDLPGLTGPAIVVGPVSGVGNVYVTLTAPVNAPVGSGVIRVATACTAVECASGTNPNCNAATVAAGDGTDFTNQKQYTCDVSMLYYNAPAPGDVNNGATPPGDLWTIHAEIEDAASNQDTVNSGDTDHGGNPNYDFNGIGCAGVGDCDYVEYTTVSGVDTATATVAWTGLSVSATDTAADGALSLNNWGNVVITAVDIRSQKLTDATGNAEMLPAAFSTSSVIGGADSGSCDGPSGGCAGAGANELVENSFINSLGVAIDYTATGTDADDAFFCIWAAVDPVYLSGPIASAYSSTIAKTNEWDIQFSS